MEKRVKEEMGKARKTKEREKNNKWTIIKTLRRTNVCLL